VTESGPPAAAVFEGERNMSAPPRRIAVGTNFSIASQHAVEAVSGLRVADVQLVHQWENR
jgi:hypothetical protein